VLCQVTSKPYGDPAAVALDNSDFDWGGLKLASYARPGKLFTANESLLVASVGKLKDDAFQRLVNAVVALVRPGTS
jgi:mRNA interferase MazF